MKRTSNLSSAPDRSDQERHGQVLIRQVHEQATAALGAAESLARRVEGGTQPTMVIARDELAELAEQFRLCARIAQYEAARRLKNINVETAA